MSGFQANLVRTASKPRKTTSVQIASVGSAFMGLSEPPVACSGPVAGSA